MNSYDLLDTPDMIVYTMYMNMIFTATEARKRWFDILDEVETRSKSVGVMKEGRLVAKVVPVLIKSKSEIRAILSGLTKIFGTVRTKYTSVLDTPAWRKKERKYLRRISEGKFR